MILFAPAGGNHNCIHRAGANGFERAFTFRKAAPEFFVFEQNFLFGVGIFYHVSHFQSFCSSVSTSGPTGIVFVFVRLPANFRMDSKKQAGKSEKKQP
jgi:hypothetical protein